MSQSAEGDISCTACKERASLWAYQVPAGRQSGDVRREGGGRLGREVAAWVPDCPWPAQGPDYHNAPSHQVVACMGMQIRGEVVTLGHGLADAHKPCLDDTLPGKPLQTTLAASGIFEAWEAAQQAWVPFHPGSTGQSC